MPELPEVETVRRSLAPALEGAMINGVSVDHPRMLRRQPRPRDFGDRLLGRRIGSLGRHGKFLMIDVDGDLTWVVHLGMSGRVGLESTGADRVPHTHVVVETDSRVEFISALASNVFDELGNWIPPSSDEIPWLKIRIDDREGWVQEDEDLMALGLFPVG